MLQILQDIEEFDCILTEFADDVSSLVPEYIPA